MPEVRRAGAEDVAGIAAVLARAFGSDPVAAFLFPEPGRREEGLRRFFAAQLRHNYLDRGEVWVEANLRGAALWMPPDPRPAAFVELVGHLSLAGVLRGRFVEARRLARMLALRHPSERHYYLGTIGTEPALQGRGIGSALLDAVLAGCDATRTAAYLESSRQENLGFYESRGFRVREEVVFRGDGPRLWLMWRSANR